MKFTVNYRPSDRAETSGTTLSQLHMSLKKAKVKGLNDWQVRIEKEAEDGIIEGLNAYFNANRAWVIWNNEDGEWLYPVNFRHNKLEPEHENCWMENGQCDEYSIQWSHSHDFALKLLNRYFETGERAPWVNWTEREYWLE